MPLSILNNPTSQLALRQLNKETSNACKSLKKVSEGQKINSAQDGASDYAISERMLEQIRSLEQSQENIQNGSALMKIAGGGVENIIEFLRDLRELAINAATDTNTDEDRAILQKKADQILLSINDVATSTNYNGKNLLDGTFDKIYTTTEIATAVTEIETPAVILEDGTITGDGVYTIPEGFSGTITLGENAKNVEIKQASSAALQNVQIVGNSNGNTNLWLDNLNITNSTDLSVIKMQGSGNTLTIKGTNNLSITSAISASAVINVGDGTTIQGADLSVNFYDNGTDALANLNITNNRNAESGNLTGAAIGSDARGSGGNINFGTGVNVTVDYTGTGAGIGSGAGGTIGDIQIGNRAGMITVVNHSTYYCDEVWVDENGNVYGENDWDGGNAIGYGMGGTSGNIKVGEYAGFSVNCYGAFPAIIAANTHSNPVAPIVDRTATRYVYFEGREYSYNVCNLQDNLNLDLNNSVTEPTVEITAAENSSGTATDSEISTETTEISIQAPPLVIHTGTRANQSISITLNDMHTKSLKSEVPNAADLERLNELQRDMDEYKAYEELLEKVKTLTLDDLNLSTRENANIAIRLVDGALNYALEQATKIGACLQRLDYTADNVTATEENTQAAESTIRDADMAREFSAYTKATVLSQAAQAVLAQANQNSGNVINLLQ